MAAKAFMVQGTGSNVGKSMLVAGLCRHFTNQGLKVRPFKPQNMSNNAAVTINGGEIGRAQALQALACRTAPHTDMNPVLLKPEGETGSQLIVNGQRHGSYKAKEFYKLKAGLMTPVMEAFNRLKAQCDLVIVEGAGSASEINLRANDIANMGFALKADIPVYIAGDIDRGGIIAALVGTHAVLPPEERALIKGFIINKFRGDPDLFKEGAELIADKTSWQSLGICPWFKKAAMLPAEDSQDLQSTLAITARGTIKNKLTIAVPLLPRIANFDDLDPIKAEPDVELLLIPQNTIIPNDCDLIILPGSKATLSDLEALRQEGWDIDIASHLRRGGHLLGICGGFQMLGKAIYDPEGLEGPASQGTGLGHLNSETTLGPRKQLSETEAVYLKHGVKVSAYEMHMGKTSGPAMAAPLFEINGQPEGACSENGKVMGTYLHGLFANDAFRTSFLSQIKSREASQLTYKNSVEQTLDELAAHLNNHLNLSAL
ncbi:MAG: cobyric acid synthase [Rhodomicrobium sp.]|nr:MAG: cobyric acid synthase [Rhodomicrobium sp.]